MPAHKINVDGYTLDEVWRSFNKDVSSTEVGYCSSSILGLVKMRFGSDERHDSRCFCFISLELEPVSPKLDGV